MSDQSKWYRDYYNRFGNDYYKKRSNKGGLMFNEGIEIPTISKLIDDSQLKRIHDSLDIGCAFGFYTKKLATISKQVTAIDVSEHMIQLAKDHCKNFSNISFYRSDFISLQFTGKKYDLILACFMLGYFNDLNLFFSKVRELSHKGSLIITSMLHPIVQCKVSKTDAGYVVEDYFKVGKFESDFLSKEYPVSLNRWNYPDVLLACKNNSLFVEQIIEPKPPDDLNPRSNEKLFYSNLPSVSIFLIKQL
jgi:2-polyprenyl-3-methyl-5-hydroxy-6-metoxy-1,4-benzoquinol methylase